jgi:ketosteroid isomerase-like protein
MKNIFYNAVFVLIVIIQTVFSCMGQDTYLYESNSEHPYGLPHPDMPDELMDFSTLIGTCECQSISRINQTSWGDTVNMTWRFKYIMNGMAIQDETLKEDGKHAGSIRQFITDSARWYVHYYSSQSPTSILPAWEGNKSEDGKIILYREQQAPNGTPGKYKITFYDISENGFSWLGEWVNLDESISYPTWKIFCKKQLSDSYKNDKNDILGKIQSFSRAYEQGDYHTIALTYTPDAKIFPNRSDIISGRAAIKEWWRIKDGSKILSHKINPAQINIVGDHAYDYGYYQGQSQAKNGTLSSFQGKYVIVWKKQEDEWKIFLDIWNGL